MNFNSIISIVNFVIVSAWITTGSVALFATMLLTLLAAVISMLVHGIVNLEHEAQAAAAKGIKAKVKLGRPKKS